MNLCMVAHLWSTNIFGYDKLWGPSQRVVTLLAEARTYCARSPHCQPLHLGFGSRQFPPPQGGGEGLL